MIAARASVSDDAATPDMSWLKEDLIAHAVSLGLNVSPSMTKPEILALIEAAS